MNAQDRNMDTYLTVFPYTTDCTGNWIVMWIVLTLENTSGLILLDTGHCSHLPAVGLAMRLH